jgi:hypothetical protein
MIHSVDQDFDFDQLVLKTPVSYSSGGGHFIKYSFQDSPLYIRPPKSQIKGVAKSSNKKRMNCDLQFSRESEDFIQWIETLENKTRKVIFENREKWFDSQLELEDIENSFISSLKSYKSAKYYLMRATIPMKDDDITIKIYDEEENTLGIENLKDNVDVVTIIECKGIRCSTRNFQIEFEIKQMMIQETKNLFEKCILVPTIKARPSTKEESYGKVHVKNIESNKILSDTNTDIKKYIPDSLVTDSNKEPIQKTADSNKEPIQKTADSNKEPIQKTADSNKEPIQNTADSKVDTYEKSTIVTEKEKRIGSLGEKQIIPIGQSPDVKLDLPAKTELCEVDFNLEEITDVESVQLKKRNEVYYEMYREARRKAKVARDLALSAYLEAKRIKNTYMLDNLKDSDESDNDFEEDDDMDDEDIESETIEED